MDEFKFAFPYNKRFLTDEMELIISVDEPDSGIELENYLSQQSLPCPYIIKSNPNKHEWRNHAKATNVGIRNSSGEYILIMSPESICVSNVYEILVQRCKQTKETTGIHSLHIGRIAFCKHNNITDDLDYTFASHFRDIVYRGSACLHRDVMFKIRGFDENFEYWGGEDDDMRYRLQMMGYGSPVKVWDAKAIHYENKNTRVINKNFVFKPPTTTDINNDGWGSDF